MKDQTYEEGSVHKAILHQTKEKYKQLNSSLLLTSSLISHKHKISQLRKESTGFPRLPSCKGLLKTCKMNLQQAKCLQEQPQKLLSNIQELKFLARKLQQEQMTKLGKQNKKAQDERPSVIPVSETQITLGKDSNKKHNKRKIVKGRPQMHVFIKKRKILNALLEQEKQPQLLCTKGNFRQTINDILNKNNLLKFITKNKISNRNQFHNLIKEKPQELIESTEHKTQAKLMRKSAVSFNNIERTNYLNRFKTKQEEDAKQHIAIRHFSLGHKRYSASQTIQ